MANANQTTPRTHRIEIATYDGMLALQLKADIDKLLKGYERTFSDGMSKRSAHVARNHISHTAA